MDNNFTVDVNDEASVVAIISNANGLGESDVTWSSSDETIVSVTPTSAAMALDTLSATAKVRGVSPGTATITIVLPDGRSASVEIKVNFDYSLTLDSLPDIARIGEHVTVQGIFKNIDPMLTEDDISWAVADNFVLTIVDTDYDIENGILRVELEAKSLGTTTVSCTIRDDFETATCEIRVELDRWSFSNLGTDCEGGKWPEKEGYFISATDYSRLLSNLSNRDRLNIISKTILQSNYNIEGIQPPLTFSKWNGSCHGMSRWVCLVGVGNLSPEILQKSSLHEVELSKDTQSAINFYHFQQNLSCYQNEIEYFKSLNQSQQLMILKDYAGEAENGGNPVLISFEWYKEFDKKGNGKASSAAAHAVVGYGLETGNWKIEGITYTNRVRIYDPSRQTYKYYDHDLYFTDSGIWCIPAWKIISVNNKANSEDNNGHLKLVTNNTSILNSVDYLTGRISAAVSSPKATLSTPADAIYSLSTADSIYTISGFSVLESTGDKNIDIFLEDNITADGNAIPTTATVILPSTDSRYTVNSEDNSMAFSLSYENYVEAAALDSAGSITFSSDGGVFLESDECANYFLSLTSNDGYYTLPWHTVEVTGSDATDISAQLTDDGVVLTGDNLTDVTVYGINDDETKEFTFSTDKENVLISEQKAELLVLIDTNSDGEYDTPINDTPNKNIYIVTFDSLTTMTTGGDGKLSSLPTPTRDGYTFDGWYTVNGTHITTNTVFTEDTTVYARWSVDINAAPSSGGGVGGGSSTLSYSISVPSQVVGGTVKVSPESARKGQRITITAKPNSGYKVGIVTVTDKDGKQITVIDEGDGKYTFTMPKSKVDVKVEFARQQTIPSTPSFTDVQSDAYYHDAVAWAVEQGITAGTTATTFSPDASCTRAQMVTFLWRAAGSPKVNATNPFTDIQPGAYYYDAVLWAVEQGITVGTTATTFSPDATVTRAQTVTFLYRAVGSPEVSGNSPFTDVASGAYYTSAVQWAVAKNVTAGTSATTFSPDASCTRAQIVTFLYRDRAK